MNFINKDNTAIFDDFFQKYGDMIDLDMNVNTYSSSYKEGGLSQAIKGIAGDDSPFICDWKKFDIMRSIKCCGICNLKPEEEFALIAHEIGHLSATHKDLNLKNWDEELYADQLAVKLGLRDAISSALLKMKEANLNPEENNQITKRISLL